ncbi:MAG: CBS domain-containing protein [Planctomycetes bacterium]|nr:CBS domain-containing protein [Planctomycetota bacterium]
MSLRDSLTHNAVEVLRILDPATIGVDQSVGDAISLMQDRNIGCVVVTKDGKPAGIFTERDVLTKVLGGDIPLTAPIVDLMTSSPQVIQESSSVADVIRCMHGGGFRHLPVVDGDGALRGVVSVKRIVEYLVEHFPSAVFNLPPDPGQTQLAREGA